MGDYFRWILLIVGVLLLAYIYLSGRSKRRDADYIPGHLQDDPDPLFADHRAERKADPAAPMEMPETAELPSSFEMFEAMTDDVEPGADAFDDDMDFFRPLEDMPEPEAGQSQKLFSSIAEKIEAFSARLTPKRKERLAATAARAKQPTEADAGEEKIIALNIMAPEGYVLDGGQLHRVFVQRGYEHGDMGIFHSRYKGKTIFSIANMLEPGRFDADTMNGMETPGITLFLQLPGPIAADVLFEVLVSEAGDLARALGANVLDSQRSTLTKQTIQHMREGIYEYMHRQKYFSAVPR
ncbi:MAG TPA: hypothetical protein DD979_14780 [Gammaproteobacteria bacterium]|jgi:cell division protein ZipA|nr:hypothetical protein [Gammaproteobacteria bacterium]